MKYSVKNHENKMIIASALLAVSVLSACGKNESVQEYRELQRKAVSRAEAGPRQAPQAPVAPPPAPQIEYKDRVVLRDSIFPKPEMKDNVLPQFVEGKATAHTLLVFANPPAGVEYQIVATDLPKEGWAKFEKKAGAQNEFILTAQPPVGTAGDLTKSYTFKVRLNVTKTPGEREARRIQATQLEYPFTFTVIKSDRVPGFETLKVASEVVQSGSRVAIEGQIVDMGALPGEKPTVSLVPEMSTSGERPALADSYRFFRFTSNDVQALGQGRFSFKAMIDTAGLEMPQGQKEAYIRLALQVVGGRDRAGARSKIEVKVIRPEEVKAEAKPEVKPAAPAAPTQSKADAKLPEGDKMNDPIAAPPQAKPAVKKPTTQKSAAAKPPAQKKT